MDGQFEFDTRQVSPTDAAITLRSLTRRFAEAFTGRDGQRLPDDVLRRRPRAGGLSAIEHAALTATAIDGLDEALRRVLVESNPAIELPTVEPPVLEGGAGATEVLALVGAAADRMAAAIADTHGAAWTSAARTADGPVSALDIARRAVSVGVEHLRAARQAAATASPG